jgi:hypothetical protein
MTNLQLFAFFGVPVAAAIFGLVIYYFEGRRSVAQRPRQPDLFDKKSIHTPGE